MINEIAKEESGQESLTEEQIELECAAIAMNKLREHAETGSLSKEIAEDLFMALQPFKNSLDLWADDETQEQADWTLAEYDELMQVLFDKMNGETVLICNDCIKEMAQTAVIH